jgi:hypothetical protein
MDKVGHNNEVGYIPQTERIHAVLCNSLPFVADQAKLHAIHLSNLKLWRLSISSGATLNFTQRCYECRNPSHLYP